MIEDITTWLQAPIWGGNVIGFIFGGITTVVGSFVVYKALVGSKEELSDADFMSISLENMDAEDNFRKTLEEDDQYD